MTSKVDVIPSKIIKSDEEEDEGIDDDPNFYRGTDGVFTFPNGDVYEGDYIAHVSGLIWREGKGTYTTQDGQVYSGTWYNDQLKENVEAEITYLNGSKYLGHLTKSQYSGSAMYTVKDGLHILSNFSENRPVGEICLLDVKGREWRAQASENDALLLPEHIYFNDIPPKLGKGTLRIQRARLSGEQTSNKSFRKPTLDSEALNKLEMKIFAKTRKTVSDLKYEDSKWYQNWVSFRTVYERVNSKLKALGEDALCQDERDWLAKYNEFKKNYSTIIERRGELKYKDMNDYKLFELYNSGDYMPPIPVFTSTYGEASQEKIEDKGDEDYFSQSFGWQ